MPRLFEGLTSYCCSPQALSRTSPSNHKSDNKRTESEHTECIESDKMALYERFSVSWCDSIFKSSFTDLNILIYKIHNIRDNVYISISVGKQYKVIKQCIRMDFLTHRLETKEVEFVAEHIITVFFKFGDT